MRGLTPVLTLALAASMVIAVIFGPADISAADTWATIAHHLGLVGASPLSPTRDAIVWELRLPRVLAAAGAGAGLALAGAVMQAITRNPLADPYLLGLSSGAALGAVLFLLVGASLWMPVGAFIGSLGALMLALAMARLLGGATPSRAILVGICVSALASAATSFLIFWSATGDSYREILGWLMGSISGATLGEAGLVLAALAICAPLVLANAGSLDGLAFGEATAISLGVDVGRLRWTLLVAAALLTGVMVAVGGAIGFVGLVVPHAVRLVTGSRHRALLPAAMAAGALFLLWSDTDRKSVV